MQAGACRIHPAGENPLHLALKRDLVDLDEGVGIGGFGRRARVAGVGLDPQRAELHGFADILVEIDDAAGDLVEAGEARLLVDDLLGRRLGDDLVARLQRGRRLRHALGLALAGRQSRQRIGGRRRVGDALAGLRRRNRDARLGILRNHGGAGRRRQGCDCTGPGGGAPCPGGGRIGRRQHAAAAAVPALSSSSSGRRRAADCRAEWRPADAAADPKKYCRSARAPAAQARSWWRPAGPQNRSGQWFETSRAALKGRIGLATLYSIIRRSQATRLTRRIRREHDGSNFCSNFNASHTTSSHLLTGFLVRNWSGDVGFHERHPGAKAVRPTRNMALTRLSMTVLFPPSDQSRVTASSTLVLRVRRGIPGG